MYEKRDSSPNGTSNLAWMGGIWGLLCGRYSWDRGFMSWDPKAWGRMELVLSWGHCWRQVPDVSCQGNWGTGRGRKPLVVRTGIWSHAPQSFSLQGLDSATWGTCGVPRGLAHLRSHFPPYRSNRGWGWAVFFQALSPTPGPPLLCPVPSSKEVPSMGVHSWTDGGK